MVFYYLYTYSIFYYTLYSFSLLFYNTLLVRKIVIFLPFINEIDIRRIFI